MRRFEEMNIRIRVFADAANPHYVNYFLRTLEARKRIELRVKQTVGMGTVDQTDIADWPIPVAPRREQDSIVTKIRELFGKADVFEPLFSRR